MIDLEQFNVSEFIDYLPSLVSLILHECENFRAGRVSNFLPEWKSLTTDPDVISNVSGVKIECDFLPEQPARDKSHFSQADFWYPSKRDGYLIIKSGSGTSVGSSWTDNSAYFTSKTGRNAPE